ncbi:MAG TPA: universal stress protein [Kofleriaceae bacterium]|nr:universal stress protein [Kofleriaceae bacterium]
MTHSYRIVVALDLSEYAPIVLEHALDVAARHDAPDLHVVTVVERGADVDSAARELTDMVRFALDGRSLGGWHARVHVRSGRAYEEIAALAGEVRANLIVVGRFGLHHPGRRLGSVASRVLDAAACPTLVVGLVDDTPPAADQCPDCVRVRAESDGERWFCDAHSAPDRDVLVSSFVSSPLLTHGGPLW